MSIDVNPAVAKSSRSAAVGPERRVRATGLKIERRSGGDGQGATIVGHAAVYDQWSVIYSGPYYELREVIRPGAFDRALARRQDVRALFNHDDNFVLGRTASGTLKLASDKVGLRSEIDAPDTQTIRDLVLSPIGRGDVDGMSFGFNVNLSDAVTTTSSADSVVIDRGGDRFTIREDGNRTIEERELLDLDLLDVSPVTFPQYGGTDVALRSGHLDADTLARCRELDRPRELRDARRAESDARRNAARARLIKTLAAG